MNKARKYDFHIHNTAIEDGNSLVAIIHYTRDLRSETASIEYINNSKDDAKKIGPYLAFMMPRVPDQSKTLVDFLQNRVNPINRIGLEEYFENLGIDPNDWIARMRINEGKSLTDTLKVLVVECND